MQLTDEQFNTIEHLLPTPRGNVKIHNRTVIDACLHMLKEDCTWRSLPERYGNWHKIYTRWNRWSKKGVWERVFKGLQELGVAPSATLVGGLDSTSVKVREHGAGALEKTASKPSVDRATTSSMSRSYRSGIRRLSPSHFVTVVSTQPSCTDFEFH